MKYKGSDYNMWDAWYMNVNGTVHGFHLQSKEGELWNVGHIVTKDLLHFEKHEDILQPLDEETYPDDCLGKYTGCAYYDEGSGKAYVYYTMRSMIRSEKIGLALSDDMENFTRYEENPVLEIDEQILIKASKPNGATDCRDMLVILDEKSGKYYGYFAAMAKIDGRNKGIITVAESKDLINWSNQQIVFVPDFNGVIEVPDVFCIDGKWYLTFLTGKRYGAYSAVKDSGICGFTLYAVADNPCGPFTMQEDRIFICGTYQSGYSCRSVEFEGKRYVLYIDNSEYGAAISYPKEIKVVDGKLRPCYAPIMKKLRTGKELLHPKAEDFQMVSTSFAWDTFGGEISNISQGLLLNAGEYDGQRFVSEAFTVESLEAEGIFKADCSESGFCIFTYDREGNSKDVYTVSMNFEGNELAVYGESSVLFAYMPHFKRQYTFEKGKEYHLRVLAAEGQIEIYIDDMLALQGNAFTNDMIKPGLFCASGNAELKDVHFYQLEKN